jgi:hypothetical protein
MKRLLALLVLCLPFVLLCPDVKGQWEGAQVQRLTFNDLPDGGGTLELHIDENDNLHLFYLEGIRDTATGYVYRYKLLSMIKQKGGSWGQPEEIGNPSAPGWGDMELGYDTKSGIIHIAYARFMSLDYDTLYYTNSELSSWQLIKIDSLSNQYGGRYTHLTMGFDTLSNVHLMWNEDFDSAGSGWYRVVYANNSTGEWVKQQVTPPIFLGGMNSGPSYLAVERNGSAHVLYNADGHFHYARNDSLNGTTWQTDTIPRPSRPLYHYAGIIMIDDNDTLHLFASGCIVEDCYLNMELQRVFYYHKYGRDEAWEGPDLVLDSLMFPTSFFIDTQSVPYLAEWDQSTHCWFFTDREPGFWQEPYQILDTSSLCNLPSSIYASGLTFVLDSEEGGHAVFAGCLSQFMGQDDSLEIFYYASPANSVEDETEELQTPNFELSQNYPNPFNQNTLIRYSLDVTRPVAVSLKIYNIVGEEVRELINTTQTRGNYQTYWDGKDNSRKEVASGIYFCRLRVAEGEKVTKMLLVK